MDLDSILPASLSIQTANALGKIMAAGFGRLEVRVEKGQVRWLRPGRAIHNPLSLTQTEINDASLAGLLGLWAPVFARELAALIEFGFGSLIVLVEHGQVRCLETVLSEAAAHEPPPRAGLPGNVTNVI